jgi:hypothetical protein
MRYWINTLSRSNVQDGVAGGFTAHTDAARLKRLAKGDAVVFYSPRTDKKFTAIAEVVDDAPYQSGELWRRNVKYSTAAETGVQPLIEDLDFIRNKKSWGVAFRRGFFEINEADYKRIAGAMGFGTG